MKRLVSVFLALVLVLTMAPAVRADMIYDPVSAFLRQHREEMESVQRAFVVQRRVFIFETPLSDNTTATLMPDAVVGVYYIWTDNQGNEWGYIHHFEPDAKGWIPMDALVLRYNSAFFERDYGDQLQHLDKELYLDGRYAGEEIRLWDYPGSNTGYACQLGRETDALPGYSVCYDDAQGRRWAKIDQYMGFRDLWLCVSDPTADFASLYPDGAPMPGFPEQLPLPPQSTVNPSHFPILIGGVVLCVIGTAASLLKRKKENTK